MKLKYILYAIGIVLLFAIAFVASAYFDLDWQYTVAIALLFLSLVLLIVLIKKYFQRKRNKEFVKKIVTEESDDLYEDKMLITDRIKLFFLKIAENIRLFFKNKNKDPIYALPCVCFLGIENSGTTSILKNPKLASSLTDIETDAEKKDYNWWFFEDLLALDISGKYTKIDGDPSIRNGWENLLRIIYKYRSKNLINGIVITIDVDSLIDKSESTLIDESVFVRKRINQLMKTVGVNIPVYVMVTKIDKIIGLDELLANLDQSSLQNTLGYTNEDFDIKTNDLFESRLRGIFATLERKFQKLYINAFIKKQDNNNNIHQFLSEFEALNNKLIEYIKPLFRKSNFQHTPKFRGVYYSSATNDGSLNSEFYGKQFKDNEVSGAQKNGYFVRQFLTQKLTEDKHLFTYLSEFIIWKKIIKHLGVLVYIGIISSIATFSYLSYLENKNILDKARVFQPVTIVDDLSVNIRQLYDHYIAIKIMEEKLNNVPIVGTGFKQARSAYKHQKQFLIDSFNKNIKRDLKLRFGEALGSEVGFHQGDSYDVVMSYLLLNIKASNELRLGNTIKFNKGDEKIIADFLDFLGMDSLDLSNKFTYLYEQYLNWTDDAQELRKREIVFEQQFNELIDLQKGGFDWLVSKASTNLDDITIKTFWPAISDEYLKDLDDDYKMLGAYTRAGRKTIKQHINVATNVLKKEKGDMYVKYFLKAFWHWYDLSYVDSWEKFLRNFPAATKDYNAYAHNNLKQLLTIISHDNPYSLAVKFSAGELSATKNRYRKGWIDDLLTLNRYLSLVVKSKDNKENQETLFSSIKKEVIKSAPVVNQKQADIINMSALLTDYYQSLARLSIKDGDMSTNIQNLFSVGATDSKFETVYSLFNKFRFSAKNNINNDFILDLAGGPFYFILDYAINRESCILNEKWKQEVFYKGSGISKVRMVDELFNRQRGYVNNFIEKNISQYISLLKTEYVNKLVHSKYQMPFNDNFFHFINMGLLASKVDPKGYRIQVGTKPITVNKSAAVKPYLSSIIVKCFDQDLQIDNFNFQSTKLIKWIPANCKDATLKISFENFNLIKSYDGDLAFANLMEDIKNKKFSIADFPEKKETILRYHILQIDTGFSFKGDVKEAISLTDPVLDLVPETILRCTDYDNR